MSRRASSASRASLASVVLIAFTLRALIPAGFMPSTEHPFTLSICPDGLPSQLLGAADGHAAHRTHAQHAPDGAAPSDSSGSTSHEHTPATHCSFATAAAAPRLAEIAHVTVFLDDGPLTEFEYLPPLFGAPRFLLAQPRAPPALQLS
jgi:hypothetical protein